MTRASPSGFNDDSMELFVAAKFEFPSGSLAIWNGYREVSIGGEDYTPAGNLMSVSDIEETGEIAARGVTVTLSGLDSSIISAALQENYQNRIATITFGTIENGVFTGYDIFKGRMDTMSIEESGSTASVAIGIENRLIDLERPRVLRYTSEDQKALYAGDLGLDYVADLQDKVINWGRS